MLHRVGATVLLAGTHNRRFGMELRRSSGTRILGQVIGLGCGVFAALRFSYVRRSGAHVLLSGTAVGVTALVSGGTVIAP